MFETLKILPIAVPLAKIVADIFDFQYHQAVLSDKPLVEN